VTWNRQTQTFHPHIHMLVAVPWDVDWNWGLLRAAWSKMTGAQQVDFRPVDYTRDPAGAAREILKYLSKFEGEKHDPDHQGLVDVPAAGPDAPFARLWEAVHVRRMLRGFGAWARLAADDDQDEPGAGDDEELLLTAYFEEAPEAFAEEAFHVGLIHTHNLAFCQEHWPEIRDLLRRRGGPFAPDPRIPIRATPLAGWIDASHT